MINNNKGYIKDIFIYSLILSSIIIAVYLSYHDILDLFFVGGDTLPVIFSSRIESFQDVVRIATTPYMDNTTFLDVGKFYRPISTLSFSFDYHVWKLNPLGYHLTDMFLHCIVSILVFLCALILTRGNKIAAWIAGILFVIHPVHIETVPAIVRRQEMLLTVFIILSLSLFIKYMRSIPEKKTSLFLSVFFYLIALGVKEVSITIPALIVLFVIIFSPLKFRERIAYSAKIFFPYFIVTVIFVIWRTYILHGTGGYAGRAFGTQPLLSLYSLKLIIDYFMTLIDGPRFYDIYPVLSYKMGLLTAVPFLALLLSTLFIKWRSYKTVLYSLFTGAAILSLACILIYPLAASYIDNLIGQAYHGKGPAFIIDMMSSRFDTPLEYYMSKIQYILRFFLYVFLFSLLSLGYILKENVIRYFTSSEIGRVLFFLAVWLFLPLGVYLLPQTFYPYYMYNSIVPFSIILSLMLMGCFNLLPLKSKSSYFPDLSGITPLSISKRLINMLIMLGFTATLFAYSPLLRTYDEWKHTSNISSLFLHKLSEVAAGFPRGSVIHINNLPERNYYFDTRVPRVKNASYLHKYCIKAWLDMNNPESDVEVIIESRSSLWFYPDKVDLEIKKTDEYNFIVDIVFEDGKHIKRKVS